jgi:hypothetical protein
MPVGLAGLASTRGPAARPGGGPVPPRDEAGAAIEARIELSRQALEAIHRAERRGASAVVLREDAYRWSRRLLGDQLYACSPEEGPRVADPEVYFALASSGTDPGRIAAFEGHLRRMAGWESRMRPFYERGLLAPLDFLEVRSRRLEAELWLARERAKEGGGRPGPGGGR